MRTREQKIYSYGELTGEAKDRARDWLIEGQWDFMRDDELPERFKDMLTEAGFRGAKISGFSLGRAQGDGVTFDVKHFDLKEWLKVHGYREKFGPLNWEGALNITIQSGRGFNPPRVSVEPTYNPDSQAARLIAQLEEAIQESIDDVCRKMRQAGYDIIEFRESDQELKDHADANDYEFDEEGRPA